MFKTEEHESFRSARTLERNDGSGNSNCETYQIVDRQLSFTTDAGVPAEVPPPGAKYFTEWFMVLEPEQSRYSASLTINYVDLARPEEVYAFLPSLRRYQPMASSGRCAETQGMDWTSEDFRSGLDSNVAELQADYLGHKKILALAGITAPEDPFPGEFYMPIIWPKSHPGRNGNCTIATLSASKKYHRERKATATVAA